MKSLLSKIFDRKTTDEHTPPNNFAGVDINNLQEDGLRAAQDGDLEKAINAWKSVIAKQPDDAETHFLLAAAYQVLHDIDSSSKHYRTVLKIEPSNIEAYLDFSKTLTSSALKKMSKTGQQFTMEQALSNYGYREEVLRSFATCQMLSKNFKGEVIKNHLRHYQIFLGYALEKAKPVSGIKGDPVYRSPIEWLDKMSFPSKSYEKVTLSDSLAHVRKSMKPNGVAFIFAHPKSLKNFSAFLKHRKQKHTKIGPSMDDSMVRDALSHLSSGDILLADIERVALASDFSWILNPSWKKLVLVLFNPDLMLLPELLGAFARTSILNVKEAQRICLFQNLMEMSLITGKLFPLEDYD